MTNSNSARTTTSNSSHLLHSSVTSALDALVDRWNNNLWNTTTAASTATSTAINTTTTTKNSNTSSNNTNNKIHAILLGTSDGIGLARSFGSTSAASDRTLSDDVWTGIETTWAALPSNTTSAGHYLQQPLGMGNIRIVTAFYETVVLIHLHFSPLIITFLCDPSSNIGAIRATFPNLLQVLEPLRSAIDSQQQTTTTTYYKSKSKS